MKCPTFPTNISNAILPAHSERYFQKAQECHIQCALAILTLVGITLSILAMVSYLPPSVGYCGGALTVTSLVCLAISQVKCTTRIAEGHKNQEPSSKKVPSTEPSNISQEEGALPDEAYTKIFTHLKRQDLLSASFVCKKWRRIALDEIELEKRCVEEMVCPPEGSFSPSSWKGLYLRAVSLEQNIRSLQPKEKIISVKKENYELKDCLITKDLCFLFYSREHGGEGIFEIWDSPISRKFLEKKLFHGSCQTKIQLCGQIVFCIGWINGLNVCYVDFYDATTKTYLSTFHFSLKNPERGQLRQIEISDRFAFLGLEDGRIEVQEHGIYPDIAKQFSAPEYEKTRELECRLNLQEKMKANKKFLEGHTREIIALRRASNFLFSSSGDGKIRQWDLSTLQCIKVLEAGDYIGFLQVTGKWILGLSSNRIMRWDFTTGENFSSIKLKQSKESYTCFRVLGNLLLCTYEENHNQLIEIYSLCSGECICTLLPSHIDFSFNFKDNHLQIVDNRLFAFDKDKLIVWDFSSRT